VSDASPARYTPVTMKTHMETTMCNLARGKGAWDAEHQQSTTATYEYVVDADAAREKPKRARPPREIHTHLTHTP
jgi:hypothetical protein